LTPILLVFSWFFSIMPLTAARSVGRGIGRLAGWLSPRRHEILKRIQKALGVSRVEAAQIYRRMFLNLGMTVAEFFRLPRMTEEELRDQVMIEGLEHSPPSGTPFIALVTHTGNWEWLAAATPALIGHPLTVVVKALKPDSLNRWVLRTRGRWGTRFLDRHGSARDLIKVIKAGEGLGFILDQNTKRNRGVFVDFFGTPACTTDGLSQIAALTGVDTFPVFCRRMEDHRLLVTIQAPIPAPPRTPEGILAHTRLCTRHIEDYVREHPEQWIWMHRRWKTLEDPESTRS